MTRIADRPASRLAKWQLLALVLLFWWGLCWSLAGLYFDRATEKALQYEIAQAELFVDNLAQGFERIIKVRAGMPRLLVRDPVYWKALKYVGPETVGADLPFAERQHRWTEDPILAAASLQLRTAADELNVTAIALLDPAGNCIAANNAGGDQSWVGVNYSDREYFPGILAGRSGYRMNVGKQYGVPGLILFAPVVDNGKVIGVVIAKNDLAQFGNWLATEDAFVTDRYGVIVLAHDPSLLMHTATDAPANRLDKIRRQNLYRQNELAALPITNWSDPRHPELRQVKGREHPVIFRSSTVALGNEPTAHIFRPFPQLMEFAERRRNVALGFGSAGTLALLLLAALVRRSGEQRQHLQILEQRELDYRSLAENSPDNIIRYDREHRIRYLNSKLASDLGLGSAQVVIGKHLHDIWPDSRYAHIDEAAAQAVESGSTTTTEIAWTDGTGKLRHGMVVVVPEHDIEGNIVGTIAIDRDITVIKQSEVAFRELSSRLAATLDAIPDPLFELDRGGTYLDVRAPDPQLLAAPKETLLGHTVTEMLPPDAAASVMAALREADLNGKAYDQMIRLDLENGTKWFEASVTKKAGSGNTDASFIVLSRDVTERVNAEAARAAALAEAQALARLRQDFIAHMGHELRTPLNGILGQAQRLLADSTLNERNLTAVAAIRNDGERLLESIEDILDLTGIEDGQTELFPDNFSLPAFLRDIGDAFDEKAQRKGLQFTLQLAPGLPASLCLDAHRLRQMLTKLLDNAVKFTAQGRVELQVELTPAKRLRCVVLDTGIGIPPAQLPTLFEPFTPGGDLLRRPSGTGLGLAIVHRLARRLECTLSVDSKPGEGTTFTIEFPLPGTPEEQTPPTPTFNIPTEASIEIPPPKELATLHHLALLGNMRDIMRESERISHLDSRYHSFTKRLQDMAGNYQSKALLAFIEACRAATDEPNP